MILSKDEANYFFELYYNLLLFTNNQRRIIPHIFTIDGLHDLDSDQLKSIHLALFSQPNLIDQFIIKNPSGFSDFKLDVIHSWKRSVTGRFFIFDEPGAGTIFLSNLIPGKAYSVVGLTKEFADIFPEPMPIYIGAVLMPFLNKIITDGIFSRYRLEFGSGFQHNLQRTYREAVGQFGIIDRL
ncbi:MAG: hypothetical protein ACOY90_07790 [Candidatus Zhuqueibacterota bacterium]